MVRVKICGVTREEDLKAAVEAGADSLGFVVEVPSSPRNLRFPEARYLMSRVPRGVDTVAVTVFRDIEGLRRISAELDATYLQLHGNLHHFLNSTVEQSSGEHIIGAVNAAETDALEKATEYSGIFKSILLDTAGDGGVGGTGVTHNWDLSRRIRDAIHPKPLILAGGLTPENVGDAIRRVRPYAVDVSSGVESKPGIKDHAKMFRFVAEAKEAEL